MLGDVDILISGGGLDLDEIVGVLKNKKIITDTISMKKEKFMGIARCPQGNYQVVHLDLIFLPPREWGSGLLYFTGSKNFNIMMRGRAKKMGLVLNQHGLFEKNGNRVPVYSEREIMSKLDLPWFSPRKRN